MAARVLIVGCGRLGAMVAKELVDRGDQVTIVDTDAENFRRLAEQPGLAQRHGLGEEFRQIEHAVGARDLEAQGVHHTIHGERGGERTVERYGKPGERLERRHQ